MTPAVALSFGDVLAQMFGGGQRPNTLPRNRAPAAGSSFTNAIRRNADGSAIVQFSIPESGPSAALARKVGGRLGLDDPYLGNMPVNINATWDGKDKYSFNINGKRKSVSEEALMRARGSELAGLLGIDSFTQLPAISEQQNGEARRQGVTTAASTGVGPGTSDTAGTGVGSASTGPGTGGTMVANQPPIPGLQRAPTKLSESYNPGQPPIPGLQRVDQSGEQEMPGYTDSTGKKRKIKPLSPERRMPQPQQQAIMPMMMMMPMLGGYGGDYNAG